MELAAVVVAAAATADPTIQIVFAAILSGGGLTAIVAWRKAKPEAELSTVQAMRIALEETRTERDEARRQRDSFEAKCEAATAHAMYLERRVEVLENRLRHTPGVEVPEVPRRSSDPDRPEL